MILAEAAAHAIDVCSWSLSKRLRVIRGQVLQLWRRWSHQEGLHKAGRCQRCYRCNEDGHLARDCETKEDIRIATVTCYKCNEDGHYARDCSETEQLCYGCKKPGHQKRDCPTLQDNEE